MMGHWKRFFIQMGILVSMVIVNAIDQNIYFALVSFSIIVLPVASWTVFGLLLWTSHEAPDVKSLRDRVDDALTLALISTVAASIGVLLLARLLGIITNPVGGFISVALGFIVVEVSFPAIGFLRTWRDLYLPMIRRKHDDKIVEEVERTHESGLIQMEARLLDSIDANTRLTQQASDNANRAYTEANSVNEKIAEQGAALLAQADSQETDRATTKRVEATGDDTNIKVTEIRDRKES